MEFGSDLGTFELNFFRLLPSLNRLTDFVEYCTNVPIVASCCLIVQIEVTIIKFYHEGSVL